MAKLSIVQFHHFMRGKFTESVHRAYESHQILCEADLQSFAWHEIRKFLSKNGEASGKFRILNKPFLRECKKYPDLVVFRKNKPWVLLELKESKYLPEKVASGERDKLLEAREELGKKPKRGYLVYVARYGNRRTLHGPKGPGAHYFFEVPIVLAKKGETMDDDWRHEFKKWSKYMSDPVL